MCYCNITTFHLRHLEVKTDNLYTDVILGQNNQDLYKKKVKIEYEGYRSPANHVD